MVVWVCSAEKADVVKKLVCSRVVMRRALDGAKTSTRGTPEWTVVAYESAGGRLRRHERRVTLTLYYDVRDQLRGGALE